MKLGIVMMLIASLSVALLSIPSKVATAQTSPENQTNQTTGQLRGLTMPDTQSPENQTNQPTGQPRGLTMPDTQSPENQTNQTTGQLRGLTMPTTK